MKDSKITERIIWSGAIPYKFEKEGKTFEGATVRAVVLSLLDGMPYRLDIVKCSKDFMIPDSDIGVSVTLMYDRFGRLVGYQV